MQTIFFEQKYFFLKEHNKRMIFEVLFTLLTKVLKLREKLLKLTNILRELIRLVITIFLLFSRSKYLFGKVRSVLSSF